MDTKKAVMIEEPKEKHVALDPGNLMLLIYTLVIGLIILCGGLLPADAAVQPDDVRAEPVRLDDIRRGELLIPDAAGNGSPALHLGQDVAITVSGIAARVRVTQEFVNSGSDWVEGLYVFPLPDESAVDRLRMRIGEREIVGEIKEREEAQAIYEKARAEGKKSSLLSQNRPNIFTTRVANIGPGEKVTIIIEYQQLVQYADNTFSLRFPMAITPRYIPGSPVMAVEQHTVSFTGEGWGRDTDQVPDASRITPPVASLQSGEGPRTMLTVDLMSGFPISGLTSLYHQMDSTVLSEDHHSLTFTGKVLADRDFVLEWQPKKTGQAAAALLGEELGDNRYLLLMLMPPEQQQSAAHVPREAIFILDVSGSMAGPSIVQAKAALREALQRLQPADRFNVISFNDSARAFFTSPVAAGSENVLEAIDQLDMLQANGGTEMRAALELALDGADGSGRIRQVIFLTDGAVGNEEQLLALIHQRLGDSRLFTVGIGSAPNSYFMTRAATVGRGTHTTIGEVGEVQKRMDDLLTRLENPALTNITIQTAGGASVPFETYPAPIPDLYFGEPLMVAVRTTSEVTTFTVTGEQNGKRLEFSVDAASHGSRPGIASLWARKKIRSEMESLALGKDEAEVKKTVLATALEHKLVSKYTSLVAVDKQVTRPEGTTPSKAMVKTAAPFGLQLDKIFGGGSQTASPAPLQMLGGSLALVLAGLLQLLRRRFK